MLDDDTIWTEANVEILTARWQAGDSATTIAALLGAGVTKKSVEGKARRLGIEKGRRLRPHPTATPPASDTSADPDREANGWHVPGLHILDLKRSHCRWPVHGAGAEMRYCGANQVDPKGPYCTAHAAAAVAKGVRA